MKSDSITFSLKENQKIIVKLPVQLADMYLCDDIKIIFEDAGNKYKIHDYDIFSSSMESFYYMLEWGLKNKAVLHESIKKDIGYMWNQYLHG